MTIHRWEGLTASERGRLLAQRNASLWILPTASEDDVRQLAGIPWINVWNYNLDVDAPMHILHACLDAMTNPLTTTLGKDAIEAILNDEYKTAKSLLEQALAIDDPSEPDKYILNTYAMLNFNLADAKPKS